MGMIIVVPGGGLCNRMRALASALTLAEEYHKPCLVLWQLSDDCRCGFYRLFRRIRAVPVTVINYRSRYTVAVFARLSSVRYINAEITDAEKIRSDLSENKTVFISTYNRFYDVQHFKMLVPVKSLQRKAEQMISGKETGQFVGLHIRRTDHAGAIEYSPSELFAERMKEFPPQQRFFLATDSPEEERYFLERFGDRILYNHDKVLRRDCSRGIRDGMVDLLCLNKCGIILGSYYSSFSQTAADWGTPRDLQVICKPCEAESGKGDKERNDNRC